MGANLAGIGAGLSTLGRGLTDVFMKQAEMNHERDLEQRKIDYQRDKDALDYEVSKQEANTNQLEAQTKAGLLQEQIDTRKQEERNRRNLALSMNRNYKLDPKTGDMTEITGMNFSDIFDSEEYKAADDTGKMSLIRKGLYDYRRNLVDDDSDEAVAMANMYSKTDDQDAFDTEANTLFAAHKDLFVKQGEIDEEARQKWVRELRDEYGAELERLKRDRDLYNTVETTDVNGKEMAYEELSANSQALIAGFGGKDLIEGMNKTMATKARFLSSSGKNRADVLRTREAAAASRYSADQRARATITAAVIRAKTTQYVADLVSGGKTDPTDILQKQLLGVGTIDVAGGIPKSIGIVEGAIQNGLYSEKNKPIAEKILSQLNQLDKAETKDNKSIVKLLGFAAALLKKKDSNAGGSSGGQSFESMPTADVLSILANENLSDKDREKADAVIEARLREAAIEAGGTGNEVSPHDVQLAKIKPPEKTSATRRTKSTKPATTATPPATNVF